LAVTGAAESVSLLLAGRGVEGGGAAEPGEGAFGAETAGVVSGGDEQGASGVGADPDLGNQFGRSGGNQRLQDVVEAGDFAVELEHPTRQGPQRQTGGGADVAASARAERRGPAHQLGDREPA
jgi:hypothetical protein